MFKCGLQSRAANNRGNTVPVLFNLSVIVEPMKYFRVCHGAPLANI